MKTEKVLLISISTAILITGCMKNENLQIPYQGFTPEETGDGWEISSPSSQGFDALALEKVYRTLSNEEQYPNLRSLLVIRNDKLVGEAYFKDHQDRERIHAVMSVTKSITSLVAGIAFDRGYLASVDESLYEFIPELLDGDPHKRGITIHQILTMETGLEFDNDIHTGEMIYCNGSSLEYILSKPMVFEPGTDWYYGDGNPQVMSGIITRVSGQTMEELAREFLFKPLGIQQYYWETHRDGLTLGGMGLWLKPRDMAKIGKLVLKGGNWEGMQVISNEWVSASTVRQATHRDYGYYWLTSENNSFWASGKGGQIIWVCREKQIVVVVTSDSFAKSWLLSDGSYDNIFQGIYNATFD
jgi:CubicO group peptidase (beta-lactamase class C family)